MKLGLVLIALLAFSTFSLSTFSWAQEFKPVLGPITLTSPHGAHREYGTEWWYFTGHLETNNQATFGFELTFFRIGLRQQALSNWEPQSLIIAHFAVTDEKNKVFLISDDRERESFNQAGASNETLNVWLRNWHARMDNDQIELSASDSKKALKLSLNSRKPLVFQGDRGFSKKGHKLEEASIYTSFTRLEGDGELVIGGQKVVITRASAWMDHEFFTSKDEKGAKGWDWFALQLNNGEELMIYQLRDSAGRISKYSYGTLVRADGSSSALEEFSIKALSNWKSPNTGHVYPSSWRIVTRDYNLLVTPTLSDQEIAGTNSTGVNYWEGRSLVSGTHAGAAYVELVGY